MNDYMKVRGYVGAKGEMGMGRNRVGKVSNTSNERYSWEGETERIRGI